MQWTLKDGGEVELIPDFVPPAERGALFAAIDAAVAWQQTQIKIAGRLIAEPRLTAWIGDPDAVYTYSGRRNAPAPWPAVLQALRERIGATAAEPFNSVLCNLYRDGRDSMGFHAD